MFQISLIADDQFCVPADIQNRLDRIAANQEGLDSSLFERGESFLQSLQHEGVMAGIGFRIVLCESENGYQRNFQVVCSLNGVLEGVIPFFALAFSIYSNISSSTRVARPTGPPSYAMRLTISLPQDPT